MSRKQQGGSAPRRSWLTTAYDENGRAAWGHYCGLVATGVPESEAERKAGNFYRRLNRKPTCTTRTIENDGRRTIENGGIFSDDVKAGAWQRDGGRCRKCANLLIPGARNPNVRLHYDHIFPWSRGGSGDLSNCQLLCETCNLSKGASAA